MFYNSNRHLSFKAWLRSVLFNTIPEALFNPIANIGWKMVPGVSAEEAKLFREQTGLPVIANGGFGEMDFIEQTLAAGKADMVAMARPLLANVNLVKLFKHGINKPEKPCTHCNRCIVRTGNFPLGCYDPSRFKSIDEMEAQIMTWSASSDERVLQMQNEHEVQTPISMAEGAASGR
jgi:2,4-dienoyl-CoA reductase (NADPH2)